ncbi:MAG: HAMP domain-containing sensor histidine kinase [Opitutaceae bacterium]
MKFSFSAKVSLLLITNLMLLIVIGAGWFLLRSSFGGQALVNGPLGDRVQVIADTIAHQLQESGTPEREAVISGFAQEYGATILWMRNDGLVLAGPSEPIPEQVHARLVGFARIRSRAGPELGPREGPPPRIIPAGNQSGRFLVRPENQSGFWFGLRLTPKRAEDFSQGPPERTTLLIHVRSIWGLARLFGLHVWAGVAAIAVGISVLFWWPFMRSVSKRLRQLTHATEQIAEGRFDTRTRIPGRDEIARLGEAVDSMAGRLDKMVNGQKRFLGDVAHELGSPLARLQVAIEIIDQRAGATLQAAITDAREEAQQMGTLVNELLTFTQAGMKSPTADLQAIPLSSLVAKVVSTEDPTNRVTVQLPTGLEVRADPALLNRALANLIRNALRYAGDRATITLTATRQNGYIKVQLDDDGPGVPVDALARLGEPFYRPEVARTRESGGVGLGLAIVRSSISTCGGQVQFSNREPHGFRTLITLKAV